MRIGLVCPDLIGHLNPMLTLARELKSRGHHVILFSLPKARQFAADVQFVEVSGEAYERSIVPLRESLAASGGWWASWLTGRYMGAVEKLFLERLPDLLRGHKVEAVIFDQISPSGGCVAEWMGLPFIMAMNALNMLPDPNVPPVMTNWEFDNSDYGVWRNWFGNIILFLFSLPVLYVVRAWRKKHKLKNLYFRDGVDYGWAQLSQAPRFFELPRDRMSYDLYYTAPWHEPDRDRAIHFPWHSIDSSKPLVYASLGTVHNGNLRLYQAILDAVRDMDVQLVLTLGCPGGGFMPLLDSPPNALIVHHAPQLELLKQASVLITHAGLNTVLEGLAAGLPMLCLPITNDQPGVAERIRYLGCGLTIPASYATSSSIYDALVELFDDEMYGQTACSASKQLKGLPSGVTMAANIIESILLEEQHAKRL